MILKQSAQAIRKLVSQVNTDDEVAMIQLYATCLALLNEAIKPENFNSREMNVASYRQQSSTLHTAIEHLRQAAFDEGDRSAHLQSAITCASSVAATRALALA